MGRYNLLEQSSIFSILVVLRLKSWKAIRESPQRIEAPQKFLAADPRQAGTGGTGDTDWTDQHR